MLTNESRARDFPSLAEMTYLNTAAESIPPGSVHEALDTYWKHKSMGMRGRDFHFPELEKCREIAARLLKRKPSEVSFCSCSSEAYNLLASTLQLNSGCEVVISDLDFPAGATPWLTLPDKPGVQLWKSRDGALELDDLENLLSGRTQLVQISLVSFLNGHRIPWKPFHDLVRALAPDAILSVDITQAFGRVELDCLDADILISSTHKWILGTHGSCVVAIPEARAGRLTTTAGGWFHISNAFDSDRFTTAEIKTGAASFSVGMPNFPAIYALRAAMEYIESVGVANIAAHADPLVKKLHTGLRELGIQPMAAFQPDCTSGIVSFRHPDAEKLNARLLERDIHIMHQAGRLRVSVHGYNTEEDVERFLNGIRV